ncbi:helix-turn-helix domain-containing protein [Clostridium sp.]|uniref:helix-turn-helix domain-containing protein n=1 Tax=Clostridium sp. TaxID=1506 RepID=UPI0039EB1026
MLKCNCENDKGVITLRRPNIDSIRHSSINDTILNIINSVDGITITSRLDDALAERGLSQKDLAEITGLRQASISELIKGDKTSLNKLHIIVVMIALRITDMSEILSIEFDEKTKQKFDREATEWIETKSMPLEVIELVNNNKKES